MKRLKFIGGLCLGLFLMGLVAAYQMLFRLDAEGIVKAQSSWLRLEQAAAAKGCVTQDSYLVSAEGFGWQTEKVDPQVVGIAGVERRKIKVALRVYVKPVMPLAKEPFITFLFDEHGCIIF